MATLGDNFHRREPQVRHLLEKIRTDTAILPENRKVILGLAGRYESQGISFGRIQVLLQYYRDFARRLGKPFRQATREDIERFLQTIEKNGMSPYTVRDIRHAVKKLYKDLSGREEFPKLVKWIKTTVKAHKTDFPAQGKFLTADDMKKLAAAADNPRDRALAMLCADVGPRPAEICSADLGDLTFDQHGAAIHLKGKTGPRKCRLIASVPAMSAWVALHPHKGNQRAPLFVGQGQTNRGERLSYKGFYYVLLRLGRKAGMDRNVTGYLLRHSAATMTANILPDNLMKQHFGWTMGSRMAGVYVNAGGLHADRAILKAHGLITEDDGEGPGLAIINCPRCRSKNSPEAKMCAQCGLLWDTREAVERERQTSGLEGLAATVLSKGKPLSVDSLVEELKAQVLEKVKAELLSGAKA